METLKFKTNIKCTGCVAKVTPVLNSSIDIDKWEVDIMNPGKILTVNAEHLDAQKIITTLEKAGFTAEKIEG